MTRRLGACLLGGSMLAAAAQGQAAVIVIENADEPGVGLNDQEPRAPAPGNEGTSAGQQRYNVMRAAADHWQALLDSDVEVVFQLSFAPLSCDEQIVLGSAGPALIFRDFENAPLAETWYHSALAEALAGQELSGTTPDIIAQFNGDEVCDAGSQNRDDAPDHCRTDCSAPGCGDGVVDAFESCDQGAERQQRLPARLLAGTLRRQRSRRWGDLRRWQHSSV